MGQEPAAVEFDKVSLAFDDHVVLRDLSFSVPKGSMRILLGASGAGKSLDPQTDARVCCGPTPARFSSTASASTEMSELELLKMRADVGMVFQENALFDSLTVGENVGYRLYEETEHAARRGARRGSRRCWRSSGLSDFIDTHAVEPVGRPAPPRRHRAARWRPSRA